MLFYQILEMLGLKKEDVNQADVQKIISGENNKKSEQASLAHIKKQLATKTDNKKQLTTKTQQLLKTTYNEKD